jgi:hypothetical protein
MTLIDFAQHLPAVVGAVPDPGSGEMPPDVADRVLTLLRWGAGLAVAACVGGIIYAAGKMALAHRRGDDTNVAQLGWVLAACILIGSASSLVTALL